ncbi:hypothetical protein BpHYR1_012666 [Brachionus plicatilis]|uniref:Uncharacterized protein n=1 Tax=Brachionus plicatilis TaxID=10195 RepID=A0A3M7Q5H5_BRAPC|nr:hypothetical protein BpHYR1_012666 [Brachionus plicatilis]
MDEEEPVKGMQRLLNFTSLFIRKGKSLMLLNFTSLFIRKGKSLMVSDFLVAHSSCPFFYLNEDEWEKAIEKYSSLLEYHGIKYEERTCTGSVVPGQDDYHHVDTVHGPLKGESNGLRQIALEFGYELDPKIRLKERFWWCLVGYNDGATYGQVLKAYFSGKSKKHFIFEILSLKEQQLFKGFAIFGTLGLNFL